MSLPRKRISDIPDSLTALAKRVADLQDNLVKVIEFLRPPKLSAKILKSIEGMTLEEVIHDFVHSKDKRFKGKSKKERIRMALGAHYGQNK